jgi:hypothetical protein
VTVDRAWVEARLAEAPPLSDAQLATLRTVFRPVIPAHTKGAATPASVTAPQTATTERTSTSD